MTTPPAPGTPVPTTMTVLFHDRHGALERVIGAARRQGCAIATLSLERSDRAGLTRLLLTIDGGHPTRLARQLARLVDVVAVHDATSNPPESTPTLADIALTPFRSQADGTTPVESDATESQTLTEE